MGIDEIIKTGPEPLQTDRCKSILVLRLGAALNSLRATQRWTLTEHRSGPAGEFDRFQAYLTAGAYLAEACMLFWANQNCVLQLARKGGAEKDKITRLLTLAHPKTGVQATLLKFIRDKETFHWDCDIFEQWASRQNDQVVWRGSSGDTAGDSVMWASCEAISEYTASLNKEKGKSVEEKINDQVREVLEVMKVVIHVLEHAVVAFLEEHGATTESRER